MTLIYVLLYIFIIYNYIIVFYNISSNIVLNNEIYVKTFNECHCQTNLVPETSLSVAPYEKTALK